MIHGTEKIKKNAKLLQRNEQQTVINNRQSFLTRLLASISINSANVDDFRTRKFLQRITSSYEFDSHQQPKFPAYNDQYPYVVSTLSFTQ